MYDLVENSKEIVNDLSKKLIVKLRTLIQIYNRCVHHDVYIVH